MDWRHMGYHHQHQQHQKEMGYRHALQAHAAAHAAAVQSGAVAAPAAPYGSGHHIYHGRALHSSTAQLNLSRF
jgi:hypothetical protein